jgi:DNA-binding NarL/FixJ family response regulator
VERELELETVERLLAGARAGSGGGLVFKGPAGIGKSSLLAASPARLCGADAVAARADDELVTAGARPRRDPTESRSNLTASELRVARLAAEGMTNREIAQALFVTENTIETHLRSVFRKLEIRSRSQLARAL